MPIQSNKKAENRLIVTTSWDDGSVGDLKLSEILDRYDLKATFYISASYHYLERPLTAQEIVKIGKKYEIGAHTMSHPDLDRIDINDVEAEVVESRDYLRNILGHNVCIFSYPRGRYTPEVIDMVKRAGFSGARTIRDGNISYPVNPYEIHPTLQASNGSPRVIAGMAIKHSLKLRSLYDWEERAKELFDLTKRTGGVYHLWGHASEFEKYGEWDKIERVLEYISGWDEVKYMTNGELIDYCMKKSNTREV